MSINATTLSAAITASQTSFQVASATGITAPNFTTGASVTYLYVDKELMLVTAVSGTLITVVRGQQGTIAAAHGVTSGVIAGLVSDFPNFQPTIGSFNTGINRYNGVNAPVASAATIAAPGQTFHVTGGTAINIITPPANFVEGEITIIFDSACTWTSSNVTNGISASGTSTTAGSAVKFFLDGATQRWYPERLA
jgi:hypothetical protein